MAQFQKMIWRVKLTANDTWGKADEKLGDLTTLQSEGSTVGGG